MSSNNIIRVALLLVIYQLKLCLSQNCRQNLTAQIYRRYIQSENYPNNYLNNVHCITHIQSPVSTVIDLNFLAFDLEDTDSCEGDSLVVYDGIDGGMRLIQHSCGDNWAWPHYPDKVVSTSNEMTVVFVTDGDTTSTGYIAEYRYVNPVPSIFVLAVSDQNTIPVIRRHSALNFAVTPDGLQSPLAVDYDPYDQYIYYSDETAKNIGRIHINTRKSEILHNKKIQNPFGLRVDTIGRLLYWTDADMGTISVSSLDGSQRLTLILDGLDKPGAIVIDPNMGYIYFTDWGTPPNILKADADGTNIISIVSTGISSPQGLAIDLVERALYWIDTLLDRLEKVNFDGSGRELLQRIHERDPFGIVLDNDAIFFSDPSNGWIEMYDRDLQSGGYRVLLGSHTEYRGLTLRPLADFGTGSSYSCPRSNCMGLCLPKPNATYTCTYVLPTLYISCPPDIERWVSNGGTLAFTWTEPAATSPIGLPITVTQSHQPGHEFFPGSKDVSYLFEDTLGNKLYCNFTVTVLERFNDDCPQDILEEIEEGNGTVIVWDAPVDNNGAIIPVVFDTAYSSGDFFPYGVTEVVYIYYLENVDLILCNFTVTVVYPAVTVTCQEDIAVDIEQGRDSTTVVWDEPVDANGQPASASTHSSGDLFQPGETVVTYDFFNLLHEDVTCSFTITVTERDTTPPKFKNCPMAILKWIRPGGHTSVRVTWNSPVLENNKDFITTQTEKSGNAFFIGRTFVTIKASDDANNQAVCVFTVTVRVDDIPPVITGCPNNITMTLSKSGTKVQVMWVKPTITDNTGTPYWQRETFEPGQGFTTGSTNVTYVASDQFGNKAWCSFYVIISADGEGNPNASMQDGIDAPETNAPTEYIIIGIVIAILLLIIACLLLVKVWHCRRNRPLGVVEHNNITLPPAYSTNLPTPTQSPLQFRQDVVQYTPDAQAIGGVINNDVYDFIPPPMYTEKEVVLHAKTDAK